MKEHEAQHLTGDQIIRAVIDETDVARDTMEHLARCPLCREEKLRLERDLAALGDAASQFSPRPRKTVLLPQGTKKSFRWFAGNHSWAFASAACALLLAFFVGWNFFITVPRDRLAGIEYEMQEDGQFMAEVNDLVENPLPQVYRAIAGEGYAEVDEDLMNFMIPGTGEESDDSSSV
ncbi:MAG: hypothetical protein P8Y00_07135 [Deltaproteobacteria bacterium]